METTWRCICFSSKSWTPQENHKTKNFSRLSHFVWYTTLVISFNNKNYTTNTRTVEKQINMGWNCRWTKSDRMAAVSKIIENSRTNNSSEMVWISRVNSLTTWILRRIIKSLWYGRIQLSIRSRSSYNNITTMKIESNAGHLTKT